jgi:exodeoxyribonuclease V beta subunit
VAPVLPYNAFPAGSSYGTLLHDLLEWQALNGWPAAMGLSSEPAHTIPDKSRRASEAEWERLLELQCQRAGLTAPARALLEHWIRAILTTPLPHESVARRPSSALVLAQLHSAKSWPEMAFTLPALGVRTAAIDAEIARHVLPGRSRPPLDDRCLNGMLTGLMDLVYEHKGRYFVLDYKSNKLEAYAASDLQSSMLAHRYDVQASLYLLALHRLLKSRLAGYDYDTHMGGAVHVFLRGIEEPGAGLFITCPSRDMIETLDEMFAGHRNSQATAS